MLTDQGVLIRRRDKTCVCLYTTGDMLGLGEQGRRLVEALRGSLKATA